LEIEIPDDRIRKLCEQQKAAVRKLGKPCSRKLRTRLADLSAVVSVRELEAGRPHTLKGDRSGQFSLDLQGGIRLVFEPANDPVPHRPDGGIDWIRVTRVRIVFIGDYHD